MMRYPTEAYHQLFPEGDQGPPMGAGVLDPAEDGDHYQPDPNFFEWWYFDTVFDDGACLVVIFHSSLYNRADHEPMVELRYYPPGRSSISVREHSSRTAYSAAPDRCEVRIGGCSAVDEGNCYRLSVRQDTLAAELVFWPLVPGCKVGTGHLFADSRSGHFFDWVVPLAHARVEGVLEVAGRRRAVVGTGYHDHNWGNLYLPTAFSHWTWGRVLAGDWTVIFGDVVGRGSSPAHVMPFILARGDRILLANDQICVVGEEPARESRTGASYSRRLCLTTLGQPTVALALTARQAIEAVDFALPHLALAFDPRVRGKAEYVWHLAQRLPVARQLATWLLGKGSYVRWQADYRLALPEYATVETGQMLYEMMLL